MKISDSFFTSAPSLCQSQWEVFPPCSMWGRRIHEAPAGVRNHVTVYCFRSTHWWPLGLGQEIAWEDMGKLVWEFMCRNSYVLEGVGYSGEREHSWGLAQIDRVLHLTFQQGITIQWWKTASCGWLWQAAANCGAVCLLTSSLAHLHSHCPLLAPSIWLRRRDTSQCLVAAKVVCGEVLKVEKCTLGQTGPTGKAVHFCEYTVLRA